MRPSSCPVRGGDYDFPLQLQGDEAATLAEVVDPAWFGDRGPGQRIVGVLPSAVVQGKVAASGRDYVTTMARFVDELVDDGHRVLVVPHSARAGSDKSHNNDLSLCRAIVAATRTSPDVALVDAEVPDRVLRHAIGRCELFVASRFRAMVSSLAMRVPTVGVGWSHKYREVLEMFDLGDWAFDDSMLESRPFAEEVGRLDASSEMVERKLARFLPIVESRAAEQADLITDIVRRGLGLEQRVPIM